MEVEGRGGSEAEVRVPLEDPLSFCPSDMAYRVWCGVRVLPAFLLITAFQGFLSLAVLLASFALIHHPAFSDSSLSPLSSTPLSSSPLTSTTPSSTPLPVLPTSTVRVEGSLRWLVKAGGALPVLFFEPAAIFAYLRLFVSFLHILGIGSSLYGVWLQRPAFILPLMATTALSIATTFLYFVLLAWHSVKFEDYFAFCFVGLTLLAVLVGHVVEMHAGTELYHYFLDLAAFVSSAKRRWPPVVKQAAAQAAQDPILLRLLLKHYRLSRALARHAASLRPRQPSFSFPSTPPTTPSSTTHSSELRPPRL